MTLSSGGTGPLAQLTNSSGKSLAITMPFALPTPTLDGDTAHYANVLSDVDLDVTADILGGVHEVLVVKSATAAANPALSSLHLITTGEGLTVQADTNGNLQAVDGNGTREFTAPTPAMWDSSTTTTTSPASALSAAASTGTTTDGTDPSTTDGPGTGAQTAEIPVTTTSDGLDLTPDQDVLNGANTHYPVFIDPNWIPWSTNNSSWTWIQSAHTASDNYNVYGTSHSSQPGVGVCGTYPDGGSCSPADKLRTYYQFNIGTLITHKDVIHSAELHFTQTYSADWSCTNTYPIHLYDTHDTISGSTNWNSPPADTSLGLTDDVGGTGSSGCSSNVPFAYTITTPLQNALAAQWSSITFGLRGDESNANGLKRLSNVATLDITYDQAPLVSSPTTSPSPREVVNSTQQPCESTVGPTSRAFLGRPNLVQGVDLQATVSSTTTPAQPVRGYFDIWDDTVSGLPSIDSGYGPGGTSYLSSGSTAVFTVPTTKLTDGHAYAWDAYANDGLLSSTSASAVCHFRVDLTPPTVTVPDNTAQLPGSDLATTFPPAGNGQVTGLFAGQAGTVPFTAADPTPSAGVASGVAALRWSLNDPDFSGAGWLKGSSMPASSIPVTPTHWGTNIVYIQVEDNAGNLSQVTPYAFYVPWNQAGPAPAYGDTTGDGSPDIVAPGSDGDLYAHSVPGNSQATSPAISLGAKAADSPDGDAWANYQVTHRGNFRSGNNVDDLVAHKDGSPYLYVYRNPGNTNSDGRFDVHSTITKPPACDACSGYNVNWSETLRIAALGDVSNTHLDDAGKFGDRTGLLTTETNSSGDAALWFYPTILDNTLGEPVLLAATGWKNYDLISPGDWSGSGKPGLWARDRSTGNIYAYTFTTGTLTVSDDYGDSYTVPTLTGISKVGQIGTMPLATYPLIGSDGDLNGDGIADLWTVTTGGTIEMHPGVASSGAVASFGSPIAVGSTTSASDQWPLSKTTGTNPVYPCCHDADELNTATAQASVAWSTDHTGSADKAAVFDGGTSTYVQSSGPALDTTKSYTVSAWVKLNSLATGQTVVSQSTVNHQAFYLGYSPTLSWYFMTTTTDDSNAAFPTASGGTAGIGTWTHLTGVYNAESHMMTLYVNGVAAKTAARNDTPVFNSGGRLDIGGSLLIGSSTSYSPLNGSVSDVRTMPAALTAGQVAALAGSPAPTASGHINDGHDFTGDHTPDVIAQLGDGTLHLYNSAGTNNLISKGQIWDSTWSGIRLMTSGNFTDNTDDNADVVAIWADGSAHLYTGDGNGHIASAGQLIGGTTWSTVVQIAAGDFNGDGHTDLLGIWGDGSIHFYAGDGNGHIAGSGPNMWPDTSWKTVKLLAAGDYTNDGHADLLAEWPDGSLHLYPGDGNGNLTQASQMMGGTTWSTVKAIVPGDYNNDGFTDLLAVWGDGTVHLYTGDGHGDLTTGPTMWPDADTTWTSVTLIA